MEHGRQARNMIQPCAACRPDARYECKLLEERNQYSNVLISLQDDFMPRTTISCKIILFYEEHSLRKQIEHIKIMKHLQHIENIELKEHK